MYQKKAVWEAIANIFLDSQLSEDEMNLIIKTLKDSGFNFHDLYEIYADEVAPVFHLNLLVTAGAWGIWSDEDLAQIKPMTYKWYHKLPLVLTFRRFIYTWSSIESWKEIETKLKQ